MISTTGPTPTGTFPITVTGTPLGRTTTLDLVVTAPTASTQLVAAVLPASRSVQVGVAATAFVAIINSGSASATGVGISLNTAIAAALTFQTTDPATNALTGTLNAPVNIPAGGLQTYLIAITPSAAFAPTDVTFNFTGTNTTPVAPQTGLNTLLLSASMTPVPDIVAIAATLDSGTVSAPVGGTGAFAVATVNVGASAMVTATLDTGGATLPVSLSICETNPVTGVCLAEPAGSVTTTINAMATPTFGIFVRADGPVPFDPALNRVFVRFSSGGVIRGATSVAVRAPGP
jgi:hypothetical protein